MLYRIVPDTPCGAEYQGRRVASEGIEEAEWAQVRMAVLVDSARKANRPGRYGRQHIGMQLGCRYLSGDYGFHGREVKESRLVITLIPAFLQAGRISKNKKLVCKKST
jgi:hypothetical protein